MHAPHHLREKFLDLLTVYVHDNPPQERIASLYKAAGQLWRCTDVVPRSHHDDVEELIHYVQVPSWKRSGTYAAAARHVRLHIETDRLSRAAAMLAAA